MPRACMYLMHIWDSLWLLFNHSDSFFKIYSQKAVYDTLNQILICPDEGYTDTQVPLITLVCLFSCVFCVCFYARVCVCVCVHVCACVCMFDYHIAVAIKPLAPFEK